MTIGREQTALCRPGRSRRVYRIWDNRSCRWWGDFYERCTDDLLAEPPDDYLLADAGPHPNPTPASWGHRLTKDQIDRSSDELDLGPHEILRECRTSSTWPAPRQVTSAPTACGSGRPNGRRRAAATPQGDSSGSTADTPLRVAATYRLMQTKGVEQADGCGAPPMRQEGK